MNIEISKKEKAEVTCVTIPDCWVCMDKGFVFIRDSEGRSIFYKCICKNSLQWEYDGRQCKKYPSNYYAPSIKEFTEPKWIAEDNFQRWFSMYKNKPGVIDKLREKGVPVEKMGA